MNTMNDDRLQRFVREIILEIIDPIGFDRGNLTRFHARDMACAFLRQYQGENLMKTQQLKMWYKNQELHIRVHDLVYEYSEKFSNTNVQFIYRRLLFSEIKWPSVQVQRLTRVRWASDHDEFSPLNSVQLYQNEGDYSSIDIEHCVPTTSAEYENYDESTDKEGDYDESDKHFHTSIYIQLDRTKF